MPKALLALAAIAVGTAALVRRRQLATVKPSPPVEIEGVPQDLIDALERQDDRSRGARARRIVWSSSRSTLPPAFMGGLVQLRLLEEARVCYVHERYMAAVLCSLAYVEHALTEELESRSIERPRGTFAETIRLAKANSIAPLDVLDRVDGLRRVRNTFAHLDADFGDDSLYERFRAAKVHSDVVLRSDAEMAIEVMYACFSATLRPGDA
jgi:hypothetical protein